MKIQLLCDNVNSWMIPYMKEFAAELAADSHTVTMLHDHDAVEKGEVLFLLSCEKIFRALHLNVHTLVVHESDLPAGKGWSPVTWQILEGKNRIPVTLIAAQDSVDSGDIYGQIFFELNGNELIDEIRAKQANATRRLIKDFVSQYPNVHGIPQTGKESFYARRRPEDSRLDPEQSLEAQFNLLRVVDNERYPAWFVRGGRKYILKIFPANDE